ncbi:MAG: alpha/beta hydrolase [Caldilineaceae bacterium]
MEPTTYTYKTVEHCALHADVYRLSTTPTPSAALVWLHGGALIYGSRKNIRLWQLARYLDAGYTVIAVDYRLAPESKLPAIITDLRDALQWVREQGPGRFGIDPTRLAVVGHSAGGYLTLMAGCCVTPQPQALVALYGYGDIVGDWYSKPDPFYCQQPLVTEAESGRQQPGPVISEPYPGRGKDKFYLYCRQQGLWPQEVGGRDPVADPAFFAPYCPVQQVTPDYPPTLLLHGDHDTDVPYAQSVLMDAALARQQVPHELLTIPAGEHGFDGNPDAPAAQAALAQVLHFWAEHCPAA